MTPTLESPRLILRPFAPRDWGEVSSMLSDPLTTQFMHFAALTEEQRREWFEGCIADAVQPDADPLYWAISRKDPGDVIGWFGIGTSSDAALPGERSVGYLLRRALWNRGYMTEALRTVLAYEFDTRGTPQLRATCDVANPASARVMDKAGMRREKTVFDADFEGNRAQRHHYVISKAEYESRR